MDYGATVGKPYQQYNSVRFEKVQHRAERLPIGDLHLSAVNKNGHHCYRVGVYYCINAYTLIYYNCMVYVQVPLLDNSFNIFLLCLFGLQNVRASAIL